jgi:hypothetical protein
MLDWYDIIYKSLLHNGKDVAMIKTTKTGKQQPVLMAC